MGPKESIVNAVWMSMQDLILDENCCDFQVDATRNHPLQIA